MNMSIASPHFGPGKETVKRFKICLGFKSSAPLFPNSLARIKLTQKNRKNQINQYQENFIESDFYVSTVVLWVIIKLESFRGCAFAVSSGFRVSSPISVPQPK